MEHEVSLPCLQVAANCPYPEPDHPVHAPPPNSYIIIIIIIIIITIIIFVEFLTSQLWLGNNDLSSDVVINRIRLRGLIWSLKSFLQLKMSQELQNFAVVYMYSGAS